MVPFPLSVSQPIESDFHLFIVFGIVNVTVGFFNGIFCVNNSLSLLKFQFAMSTI